MRGKRKGRKMSQPRKEGRSTAAKEADLYGVSGSPRRTAI